MPRHKHSYSFVRSYTYQRGNKTIIVRIYRCSCGDEYFTEDPA